MTTENIDWLLNSNPWTEYRTRIDILNQPADLPQVIEAHNRMTDHHLINSIISELMNWPGQVLNSHKSAGQCYHKLSFLADIGITYADSRIKKVIKKVYDHRSEEGIFQLKSNIPVHFGGTGKDQYAWVLCDAPINVYSVAKMGLHNDPIILKAKDFLIKIGKDFGYPCTASKELGKFRGPGKKDDPCPYATMIMLKLISLYSSDKESNYANDSINSLLTIWEQSQTRHPYMFYMGTDFRKIKAPLIWYDIIHLTDTLSNFKQAILDSRFKQMIKIIESKATQDDKFIPESEWKAWKEWDFGQKKIPSAWLTFLVYRIRKRIDKGEK